MRGQGHASNDRECPVKRQEDAIIRMQTDRRLTPMQARREFFGTQRKAEIGKSYVESLAQSEVERRRNPAPSPQVIEDTLLVRRLEKEVADLKSSLELVIKRNSVLSKLLIDHGVKVSTGSNLKGTGPDCVPVNPSLPIYQPVPEPKSKLLPVPEPKPPRDGGERRSRARDKYNSTAKGNRSRSRSSSTGNASKKNRLANRRIILMCDRHTLSPENQKIFDCWQKEKGEGSEDSFFCFIDLDTNELVKAGATQRLTRNMAAPGCLYDDIDAI